MTIVFVKSHIFLLMMMMVVIALHFVKKYLIEFPKLFHFRN